jgi:hypothetical protein
MGELLQPGCREVNPGREQAQGSAERATRKVEPWDYPRKIEISELDKGIGILPPWP